MKNILYITHTPWGWIKQRPQFIAEGLSDSYKIDVYYRKSNHLFKKLNPPMIQSGNITIRGFRNIPWERIKFITSKKLYAINKFLWFLKFVNLKQYNYIWVTDPLLWWLIKKHKFSGKLIYDCMDDLIAFPYYEKYPNIIDFTLEEEKNLIQSADCVICSAGSLRNELEKRYQIKREYYIINNAITNDILSCSTEDAEISLPKNSFVYIGTISEWFDFELIKAALDKYRDFNVVLFGPIRMQNPPSFDRLIYGGVINHKQIVTIMNQAIGLIMPFVVNDLIRSVNPVKLYEYIYSGKPIAAVKYPETESFAKYVCLYANPSEFFEFIEKTINLQICPNINQMKEFAMKNTWTSRCNRVDEILKSL